MAYARIEEIEGRINKLSTEMKGYVRRVETISRG
jgi:hypothetical protein